LNELCVWNAAGLCSSTNSRRSSTKARPIMGDLSQVGVWPAAKAAEQQVGFNRLSPSRQCDRCVATVSTWNMSYPLSLPKR
jgi:hypothetical protein